MSNYVTEYKEIVWEGLPAFKRRWKGNGRINYGCRTRRRSLGNSHGVYRKVRREIRRYGFDLSELWGIDYSFFMYLQDNYPDTFMQCCNINDWDNYDYAGNEIKTCDDEWYDACKVCGPARCKRFLEMLDGFLHSVNKDDLAKIGKFIVPRLRKFVDVTNGWPGLDGRIKSFDGWISMVGKMADDFEQNIVNEDFITYYFHLWW